MTRLFAILLSVSMTTLAGIAVTIVLVLGMFDYKAILLAAAAGALLSVPITWYVAGRLKELIEI